MTDGVAVVTGAGRGIGAAVATALARAGSTVAAIDQDERSLDSTVSTLRTEGLAVAAHRLDVSGARPVEAAFDRIEHEMGPIDRLVNVAGVLRPGRVVDTSDEDWAESFSVNATGVFVMSRAAARRMIPRRAGSIVTVASNAAGVPRSGMAAYAASKAAAAHLTRCLGLELAPYGIRCNIVSPGSTDTPMLRELGAGDVIAGDPALFRTGIPLGRIADPADIAEAVLFLLSDQARHIAMQDLYVDGGAALRI